MKTNSKELFPVVSPDGAVIGQATRGECHDGVSRLLHPVVHLHIVGPDGEIFLQRRSMTKDIQPGRWDTAVGGHVDYGETIGEALRREVSEELGLDLAGRDVVEICRYVFESDRERELVNVFACVADPGEALTPDPDEISEARFWSPEEIDNATGRGILTPNFESEYGRIRGTLSGLVRDGKE
ncbi:MAG: NUDIX domain-containing protein [Clostridium sp.]|nr:NUDIX domain-containing protein [Clostridium sp.]